MTAKRVRKDAWTASRAPCLACGHRPTLERSIGPLEWAWRCPRCRTSGTASEAPPPEAGKSGVSKN